jgi:hypothetical protein
LTKNYNKHIKYLYYKLITTITKVPLMCRNSWGLRYDALKVFYSAAIETSLLYCSYVWAKNLTQTNINKLKTIQRLFAIKIIRSYRTISYKSAVTIAGLTPIDLKIKEKNILHQIKHQTTGQVLGLKCESMERKICLKPHQYSHRIQSKPEILCSHISLHNFKALTKSHNFYMTT